MPRETVEDQDLDRRALVEFNDASSILGRDALKLVAKGELATIKVGSRLLVPVEELSRYLNRIREMSDQ